MLSRTFAFCVLAFISSTSLSSIMQNPPIQSYGRRKVFRGKIPTISICMYLYEIYYSLFTIHYSLFTVHNNDLFITATCIIYSSHHPLTIRELLRRMQVIGEAARQKIQSCPTRNRIVISYSRVSEDNSFENLPILSIVLKRVTNDYPESVYLLERMICDERRVVCVLLFNEDRDWVNIIRQYEVNLDVRRENPLPAMNQVNLDSTGIAL